MKNEEILVCITNHNNNENAKKLKNIFSNFFDSIIIDSGSDDVDKEFDIKLKNVYYSGLFNKSVEETEKRNKKYLFFIASDVLINNYEKINKIISNLEDNIYLWAPSSKGQSHEHCKNFNSGGYREVPYLEGFTFLSHISLTKELYPVSLEDNLYGYGIDLLLGHNCIKIFNKKCVVDDRVEIYHREGTGYDQKKALKDMYNWMLSNFDNNVKTYTLLYNKSPGYKKLLKFLKN